jgi:hypothetical protein
MNADQLLNRIDAAGPCWLWTGALSGGYGSVRWGGQVRGVHRVVWELLVGPIPPGLTLDHLCRVRQCCNPDHLEPVTLRDNIMRSPIQVTAVHSRRTHCPQGHALTTMPRQSKQRGCRVCAAEYMHAYYEERKLA